MPGLGLGLLSAETLQVAGVLGCSASSAVAALYSGVFCMVETRRSAGRQKYSVLLPTYNEADNIAIIIWLIIRSFEQRRAPRAP